MAQKATGGSRAFALPAFGIILLLASYWLLLDWRDLPSAVGSALTVLRWSS